MKKLTVGLCMIAVLLLGFMAPAFAAESQGGLLAGNAGEDRRDEKGTEEVHR